MYKLKISVILSIKWQLLDRVINRQVYIAFPITQYQCFNFKQARKAVFCRITPNHNKLTHLFWLQKKKSKLKIYTFLNIIEISHCPMTNYYSNIYFILNVHFFFKIYCETWSRPSRVLWDCSNSETFKFDGLLIKLHLKNILFKIGLSTFWLETYKTVDISDDQLSESVCSFLNATPTSRRQNNHLNIDSQDASNIYTHQQSLYHVSNGIKVTPVLM